MGFRRRNKLSTFFKGRVRLNRFVSRTANKQEYNKQRYDSIHLHLNRMKEEKNWFKIRDRRLKIKSVLTSERNVAMFFLGVRVDFVFKKLKCFDQLRPRLMR